MPLIWRGAGIIVPILFFVSAWIVSFWYDKGETTLGNGSYIGWSALFAGIALALVGLALLGADAEDENGQTVKKKHDFFFIPVFFWGLILGGLSLYLLVFTGNADAEDTDPAVEDNSSVPAAAPTTRTVHFYNPTDDSLTYIVADETADGLISRKKVAPQKFLSLDLKPGTYLFSAFNKAKETTLSLPDREFASDETKYTKHTDDKGSFYQRILNPATKETDDYDEAWLVMDGKQSLLLIDLSTVCTGDISPEEVDAINWEDQIHERYDARDLIEPLYNQFKKGKEIKVLAMGEQLPSPCDGEKNMYFLLVPDPGEANLNSGIAAAVKRARFP